jgi:hypothetical protein
MRRRTRLRRNRPTKTRSKSGKLTRRFWNIELGAEIAPDSRSMRPKSGKLVHRFWNNRAESGNCSRLKEHAFGKRKTHAQPPGMQN